MTSRMRDYLLFLMLGVVAMFSFGCTANGKPHTARETYADVNDSVIASMEILANAKLAGVFDEDDMKHIRPAVLAVDALMDAYDAATKAGLDGAPVLTQIRAALLQLSPYIDKANAAKEKKADAGNSADRVVADLDPGSDGSTSEPGAQDPRGSRGVQRQAERSPQATRGPADRHDPDPRAARLQRLSTQYASYLNAG